MRKLSRDPGLTLQKVDNFGFPAKNSNACKTIIQSRTRADLPGSSPDPCGYAEGIMEKSKRGWSLLVLGAAVVLLCGAQETAPVTEPAAVRMERADRIYGPVIGFPESALQSRVATFEYAPGLRADLYWPPGFAFDKLLPVALFVVSVPDSIFRKELGVSVAETAPYVSWCAAAAARGFAAVIMTVTQWPRDLPVLAAWMESRKASLRLDTGRIFLWACSANGDAAVSLASSGGALEGRVAGMSLYYTYLSQMASTPVPGFPVEVVIPEKDDPARMRRLAAYADSLIANGNPVRVVRLPIGRHAFDLNQDTPEHRKVVEDTLSFMKECLIRSP